MSTIKVTNIDPPSAGGAVNVNGVAMPNAGPLSNRNLIINGAMQVAQRGTQITGATSGNNFTCDRFALAIGSLGTWTLDQSSDAPSGFANSVKATCTTADASPAAGDNIQFLYKVEAQDLQILSYGNSDAKSAVLSFWVKSNKTGNGTVEFLQSDNSNRLLSQQYTINSAGTWEYKTISIPADTSGLFNNDNGLGLEVGFWLNTGSNFTSGSLSTTWGTYSAANRNPSNLGVGGATSDYWQITGVQLEVGEVATPFEHRSYGDELARCQRYYEKIQAQLFNYENYFNNNGYGAHTSRVFAVNKRAAPTMTVPTPTTTAGFSGSLASYGQVEGTRIYASSNAAGAFYYLFNSAHYVEASAEL